MMFLKDLGRLEGTVRSLLTKQLDPSETSGLVFGPLCFPDAFWELRKQVAGALARIDGSNGMVFYGSSLA
jgi:hypothetical protein